MVFMSKEFASGLLNSAVYVAIATALISVWGVLYQESYYNYFGINPNLAGIELDTLTLTNGGIVSAVSLLVIITIIGLVALYQNGLRKNRIITELVRDVALYSLGIMVLVVAFIVTRPESFKDFIPIVGGLLTIGAQIYISVTKRYSFYKEVKTQQRFKYIIEKYNQSHKKTTDSGIYVPKYILGIIGVIFFIVITISAVKQTAFMHANTQESFTILNRSSDRIQLIVVARNRDGYIVKDYDTKLKTFQPGYKVMKGSDKQTFELVEIE